MYRQKLQQGNRTSDRVQSSPGNLRNRSVLTNRNKSKDTEWELLSAWDIGDDSDEIGGLGIVSWNKRSAKPKPETNHAHSQNAWQQYLCTTGTKCTYIEDVKEFVESSLDPRLKPRARSAPERPSVSEIVSEIKEDKKDITKSKHLNGIYSSTKTFDQKRTLMHRASAGSYGSHRTAGHHGGSSESARHRSSSSGDISNSRTAKSAINMSRLIISIGERKHDLAIKNGKSTEKQNGINNKTFSDKKTPTFSRSTETSGAATPNESPPTPIPAPRTENNQSPNAVKFSYTKSKTPGSTTTLLSDNTDSSSGRDSATNGDERNLHSSPSKRAHFIYQPESTASYYPRANIDHKLQKHTSKCNVFDSQTVSVSDILNSTPRLERHITLTENDSPQGAKNNNRFKVKTPSKDSHRTDKTEGSSFPPVYSRPTTETSTQSLQLTHNGTSAKTLPRVSSTSKLVGDAENGSEIGYCENGQIEEGYIDPESELGMVMLREGVDLSRFTEKFYEGFLPYIVENHGILSQAQLVTVLRCPVAQYRERGLQPKVKPAPSQSALSMNERMSCVVLGKKYTHIRHRGPPGFRASTARNPLTRARETTQKKIYTQQSPRVPNGGSISYPTQDAQNQAHWQSSLNYLYDVQRAHEYEAENEVHSLTESLDRSEPYHRKAGLKNIRKATSPSYLTTCQYLPYTPVTLPQESLNSIYKLSRRKKVVDNPKVTGQLTIGDRTFTVAEFTAAAAARATTRRKIASSK